MMILATPLRSRLSFLTLKPGPGLQDISKLCLVPQRTWGKGRPKGYSGLASPALWASLKLVAALSSIAAGLVLEPLHQARASTSLVRWENVADRWEPYHLTPLQRQWFNSVGSCCSTADGWPADDWERRQDDSPRHYHYWVSFMGTWYIVPDYAEYLRNGNPIGVPVVWMTRDEYGSPMVRCFVPGPEN